MPHPLSLMPYPYASCLMHHASSLMPYPYASCLMHHASSLSPYLYLLILLGKLTLQAYNSIHLELTLQAYNSIHLELELTLGGYNSIHLELTLGGYTIHRHEIATLLTTLSDFILSYLILTQIAPHYAVDRIDYTERKDGPVPSIYYHMKVLQVVLYLRLHYAYGHIIPHHTTPYHITPNQTVRDGTKPTSPCNTHC